MRLGRLEPSTLGLKSPLLYQLSYKRAAEIRLPSACQQVQKSSILTAICGLNDCPNNGLPGGDSQKRYFARPSYE